MHTEGPWTYDPENGRVEGPPHEHPQNRKIGLASGVQLADSHPTVCYVRGYHGSGEADANGRLLAASLDLLEACKGASVMINCALKDYADEPWAKAVKSAIKKAEEG